MSDEIEMLRRMEAHQCVVEARLDVLARALADRPYTILITPQMPAATWGVVRRIEDNRADFVLAPRGGLPEVGFKPEPGHVLALAIDTAERLIGRGR